jgi:hypothetical protein
MGDGRNHNFVVPTRQKDDVLFEHGEVIAVGTPVGLDARLVSGYGSIKFFASSDVAFQVRVEESCSEDGPWTETNRLASALDAAGINQLVCTTVLPCSQFMRVFVDALAMGMSEFSLCGLGHPIGGGAAGGGGVVAVVATITGNQQVQNIETMVALAGGATFTGGDRDCINFEGFSYSMFLTGGGVATNIDMILEHKAALVDTYREVDRVAALVVGIGADVHLEKIFGVARSFNRIRIVNNTANALAVTEIVTMQKPIA